ncbi:MAG: hypothetical protein CL926_13775 [Deltaproteobacteria bacterium]|nr:hypothetical protein [Deltaproteobacteria bacterium]
MEAIKEILSIDELLQLDLGTLSGNWKSDVEERLRSYKDAFVSYEDRIGPGFLLISSELKRYVDNNITGFLKENIQQLTSGRFENIYCDVRLYPDGREFELYDAESQWCGSQINAHVTFVIAVPESDKLDIVVGMELQALFEEDLDLEEPIYTNIEGIDNLSSLLNIEIVSEWMGGFKTDHFDPSSFAGLYFSTGFDACEADKFLEKEKQAQFSVIAGEVYSAEKSRHPDLPITLENYEIETCFLIAAFAQELDLLGIEAKALTREDSLFCLMRCDHVKTVSLTQSIKAHFDVIYDDGYQMSTVGNVLDFVFESLTDSVGSMD